MAENEPPIWEEQEYDTKKSWEAFVIYRDLGPDRSLQKAADKKYGKSSATVRHFERWSVAHYWVKRCEEYDKHQYALYKERKQQMQVEVEQNAWGTYIFVQSVIEQEIESLTKLSNPVAVDKAHEILGLAKRADDFARRIVSLPDRISESKTDITSDGKAVPIAIVKMDLDAI